MRNLIRVGDRFGEWTVVALSDVRGTRQRRIRRLCRCSCGTERMVFADALRSGISHSCGCAGVQRDETGSPRGLVRHLRVAKGRSGYRGVWYDESRKKFAAALGHGSTRRRLGRFDTAEAAARAYDAAARKIYGPLAALNFPREGENSVIPSMFNDGFCPEGHSYGDYGRPDRHGVLTCRICNAAATHRRRFMGRDRPDADAGLP